MQSAQYKESVFVDRRTKDVTDVVVREICDLETAAKCLIDNILFEGLDILRCYQGSFRFSFKGLPDVELHPGETLVIYPRHIVTIHALEGKNRLVYGIFGGSDVESYFDSLGFFDGAMGTTESHFESIRELREKLDATGGVLDRHCLAYLTDILSSQASEMRTHGNRLVYEAMRQIHLNLRDGIVQVKPLCVQLGVSRVYLHRLFVQSGLGSPSDYIKCRQLHLVRNLLDNSELTISEVARRAGFISSTHFVAFVRRMTGLAPTQIRHAARR